MALRRCGWLEILDCTEQLGMLRIENTIILNEGNYPYFVIGEDLAQYLGNHYAFRGSRAPELDPGRGQRAEFRPREGYSEPQFVEFLIRELMRNRTWLQFYKSQEPVLDDMASGYAVDFVLKQKTKTDLLAIEIDEPYDFDYQPIHTFEQNLEKDIFLGQANWPCLRISERQAYNNKTEMLDLAERILNHLHGQRFVPHEFEHYLMVGVTNEPRWDANLSREYGRQGLRMDPEYCGHIGLLMQQSNTFNEEMRPK